MCRDSLTNNLFAAAPVSPLGPKVFQKSSKNLSYASLLRSKILPHAFPRRLPLYQKCSKSVPKVFPKSPREPKVFQKCPGGPTRPKCETKSSKMYPLRPFLYPLRPPKSPGGTGVARVCPAKSSAGSDACPDQTKSVPGDTCPPHGRPHATPAWRGELLNNYNPAHTDKNMLARNKRLAIKNRTIRSGV